MRLKRNETCLERNKMCLTKQKRGEVVTYIGAVLLVTVRPDVGLVAGKQWFSIDFKIRILFPAWDHGLPTSLV